MSTQKTSKEILQKLINLYNKGEFKNVIQNIEKLLENNPKDFILWNLLGASNKRLGNLNEAINAFKKLLN